jgi:glyoxylase-like metal-dependent hydrolase (beta-lactamase superfamily II)
VTDVRAETSEPVPGIRRLTFHLPMGFEHVHCWFVRGEGGGWILVDTALAVPGVEPLWESALAELDGPVEKVLVTHFHPDHVGGAGLVAELTGAPVYQGRSDFADCRTAWADPGASDRLAVLLARHGFPKELGDEARAVRRRVSSTVRFCADPVLVEPGEEIDGWRVVHLPGHAPGHLAFLRDGVLAAGDVLLARITPSIPLDLLSGPDPLGDYLDSLERLAALEPALVLPGHEDLIDDAAQRAGEIAAHHEARLGSVAQTLGDRPLNAYEASVRVFGEPAEPISRLFAFFETLSHLEYLALRDRIERVEPDGVVGYCSR